MLNPGFARRRIVLATAFAIAIAIFAIDTFTSLGIAVAVFYAVVVLIAGQVLARPATLAVSAACLALTVLSYIIQHGDFVGQPMVRAIAGISAIAITTALTIRNQATELALRQSRANLAEAQRLSHTGSFSINTDNGDLLWSDEMYRIFELDPGTRPTADVVLERTHPEDRTLVRSAIEGSPTGQTWDFEHRLQFPDGAVKYVKVLAHAVGEGRGGNDFVGAVMDISDTKRTEERIQALQSELAHVTRVNTLGELTASIAHEVNQPLAAIVTNGEVGLRWLDRDKPDLSEVHDALTDMIAGARRASDVVQRLRQLYRKSTPRIETLRINDLVADAVSLLSPMLRRGRVQLELDLDPTDPSVSGDAIQLQQVVVNLLANGADAIDTAGDGPRRIAVRTRAQDEAVVIEVEDSGKGIAPDAEARIFDAFYTTKSDGMGMGLSICRSIVVSHSGSLRVRNNPVRGATFVISLPPQ